MTIDTSEILYNTFKFLAILAVALAVTKVAGHFFGEEQEENDIEDKPDKRQDEKQ